MMKASCPCFRIQACLTFCFLFITLGITGPLFAQTNLVVVDYEWTDSMHGPWTNPPASEVLVMPNGSLVMQSASALRFFRLKIDDIDLADVRSPVVAVADLPSEPVTIAREHLQFMSSNVLDGEGGSEEGFDAWTNAVIAPIAYKVFDLSYQNGDETAYVEFKIISDDQPTGTPVEFLVGNEAPHVQDLGYIMVSLNDGDAPVPQFDTKGATPCEELLCRVGYVPNIKIMRFGPSFATVENEHGELLANAGADPFRIPADYLTYKDVTFTGEFDSETNTVPMEDGDGGPKMAVTPYETYQEFKEDYVNNPVFQEMRARKAMRVQSEWIVHRGGALPDPEEVTLSPGEDVRLMPDQDIIRFFLDDDEAEDTPVVSIHWDSATTGLLLTGGRPGGAYLTVESAAGIEKIWIKVVDPLGTEMAGVVPTGFTIGWQPAIIWNKAGGWNAQAIYRQTSDYNRWCPKVGCGPVAWAMLFAYWDRHNVPAMFYSSLPGDLTIQDAPRYVSENFSKMHTVYDKLHDYCDVICSPSGAGATPPGDMIEGGFTYLWFPAVFGKLGYGYSWSWNLMDPDWNQPSSVVRTSVKEGRPAVLGLGYMWHYVVAYAYRYQEYKVSPNLGPFMVRRWFLCNEGWERRGGAWYSGYDTFLGATFRPWQK